VPERADVENASAPRSAKPVAEGTNPIHGGGWVAMGIGVLFLAAVMALRLPPLDGLWRGKGEWEPIIPSAFAALLAVSGLSLAARGAGAMRRTARRRRLLAERPSEPWIADHPWRRDGAADETGKDVAKSFRNAVLFSAFAAFGVLMLALTHLRQFGFGNGLIAGT